MEIMSNEEMFDEKDLMKELIQKLELKIKTLELIKDKLIVILNECKCNINEELKQEVQLLIDNYHNFDEIRVNEENQQNLNNFETKLKINLKSKTILKSIKTEPKSELKVNKIENKVKKKYKLKLSKTNCFVCDWIGCDFNTNTNRKLRLHQRIHKPIVRQEIIVEEEEEKDDIPKKYPSGRPKKGEPPRPKRKQIFDKTKVPCSWPGCEKTFTNNAKMV
jgi:hypothetical protein